ncbi:alpha/beta hydrolase [Sporolactobacillus shoreicorticis]|uniref:Alpha/beta fold hydrolase n=1 Tax=Sporolactobacillus shoreicorticis TaxID=1923877 RepID=A0ABW5S295_9BACL|nr:alpha/beta fold hydrolase [Sporolactobacillus shoreicorticis]MCO7126458.1 alpha/beta hydrolase [Sporolactobacillus shoreicorticis]
MWMVRHIIAGNEKINYKIREFGDPSASETVVLIHGQAWTGEVWRMVKRLQGVHSIVPDMAGCGDSGLSTSYDFTTLSEQLVDILDQLRAKKFWLVGHSWGASLALHFADHYSERVKGLIRVTFPVICIIALVSRVNEGNFSAYATQNPPFSRFSIR